MTLLPLGSVLKINDLKVCIIGYTSVEKENASVLGYFVVSYPLGFTNIDKVFFVPYALDCIVLKEGYKTMAYEKLLKTLTEGLKFAEKISYENLLKYSEIYKKIALSKKEAEEL